MRTTSIPSTDHPLRSALHALGDDLRIDTIAGPLERDLAEQRTALAASRSEQAAEVRTAFDDLVDRARRAQR